MKRVGVAIFVKTPGLSPVKTRLAASIGAEAALALYRGCIDCVVECVEAAAAQASLQPYWAVAEARGASQWMHWPVLVQAEGDLGERMAGIHQQLRQRHAGALLLGADAPALTPDTLVAACAALRETPSRVIAPAHDGGFVLFGSNLDHESDDWSGVPYGAPDTALRFLAAVGGELPLTTLPMQQDLDTLDDLWALLRDPPVSPAQQRLWALLRAAAEQARLYDWGETGGDP